MYVRVITLPLKTIHQMWGGQEFQFLGPWCPDRNLAVALMPLQPGSRQQRISPNIAILWEAAFYFFQNSFSNFPFYPTLPNFPPPKVAVSFHLPCDTQVNFGILFDHWRLNKVVTRIVNSTVNTFQKCFRTLESWWFLKSLSSPVASLVLLPPEAAALSKPEERFNQDLLM